MRISRVRDVKGGCGQLGWMSTSGSWYSRKLAVEKVVKRGAGVIAGQVIETIRKINFKKCHSCPMQYDIMVLYSKEKSNSL